MQHCVWLLLQVFAAYCPFRLTASDELEQSMTLSDFWRFVKSCKLVDTQLTYEKARPTKHAIGF